MAQGILQGVKYDTEFDTSLCYDIGKRALEKQFNLLAHSWFKEALKRFPEQDLSNKISFTKLNKLDIELALASAKYILEDIQGANQTYVDLINFYPESEKVAKLYAEFLEKSANNKTVKIDYSLDHKPIANNITKTCEYTQYKYTCADILKKSPSEERNLYCRYLNENHPFLHLAPLKQEIMNFDPFLAIFHDVISDNEINIMRNLTKKVKRAKVKSNGKNIISDGRTSQVIFINVDKHPVLGIIDQRVEDMTNLNMNYSEMHQFANYGIGGHYFQHYDYFSVENMKSDSVSDYKLGNRIATVLFYLSDVEQGGGTAFPYLKLHLKPKKGSAAFWYNLHHSGDRNERTMHGACPIIVGSKWVQNRWIRENDQSDRRPCLLYNDSK
ncbi:prolyl 4-hydroxylase subunit alpha-1-like [Cochliomyia hominivorax]